MRNRRRPGQLQQCQNLLFAGPSPTLTSTPSSIPIFALTFPPTSQMAVPTSFEPEPVKDKDGLSSAALLSLIAIASLLVLGMACLGAWYYSHQTPTVKLCSSFSDDNKNNNKHATPRFDGCKSSCRNKLPWPVNCRP